MHCVSWNLYSQRHCCFPPPLSCGHCLKYIVSQTFFWHSLSHKTMSHMPMYCGTLSHKDLLCFSGHYFAVFCIAVFITDVVSHRRVLTDFVSLDIIAQDMVSQVLFPRTLSCRNYFACYQVCGQFVLVFYTRSYHGANLWQMNKIYCMLGFDDRRFSG